MAETDEIRQALRRLKLRLSSGEIDEATYQRQRELILADLSPEERATFATSTPAGAVGTPAPATPPPLTPSSLGPSGGSGRGVRTSIPSLADLDLQPGSVLLGQWRLVKELGRGGFGAVFEAEELHLHEKQAVKVLDPAMVAKEELLARFRREVSLMRRLEHPRIVRVFDYREDLRELIALISMQLVAGGSVKQLLTTARAKNAEIPIPLALEILRQTLEALAEAHAQGVIHRDVTPGNVLLAGGTPEQLLSNPGRDPQVKLVDFGIAGLVERSELSQKSRVLGTAAYVAPEVLDPAVDVTPAADVYGAGAMGYELLTGKLPLGRFAEPVQLRGGLPGPLNAFVLALLEAEPKLRPPASASARELPRLLEEQARQAAARREAEERARREVEVELKREEARRQEAAVRERERAPPRQQAAARREAEGQQQETGRERLRQATNGREEAEARVAVPIRPRVAVRAGLWGGLVVALAALAVEWGAQSMRRHEEEARRNQRPEGKPVAAAGEVAGRGGSLTGAKEVDVGSRPKFTLTLSFEADCWVELNVDGESRPGELRAGGEAVEVEATNSIVLTLGNSAAVRAEVDGEPIDLPRLDGRALRDFRIQRSAGGSASPAPQASSATTLAGPRVAAASGLGGRAAHPIRTLAIKAPGASGALVAEAIAGSEATTMRFRMAPETKSECLLSISTGAPASSIMEHLGLWSCRVTARVRLECSGEEVVASERSDAAAHTDVDQACFLASKKLGESLVQFLVASSRGGKT